MIPSCGFDSVPPDISVLVSVEYIRSHLNCPTAQVDASLHAVKGSLSGGRLASSMGAIDKYGLLQLQKMLAPFTLSPKLPFPTNPPRSSGLAVKLFGLRRIAGLGWMAIGPQGPINRSYVYRTWGLHTGSPGAGYGDNFHLNVWIRMPNPVVAVLWCIAMISAICLLSLRQVRWALQKLWFQPDQGPSENS